MDDQIADAATSGNENGYAYRLFSWTKGVSTWTTGNKIRQDVEYWLVFTFDGRFMDSTFTRPIKQGKKIFILCQASKSYFPTLDVNLFFMNDLGIQRPCFLVTLVTTRSSVNHLH